MRRTRRVFVQAIPTPCKGWASRCSAFTLLEVVLAFAIFFGSLAILSQIQWNGTRAAVQARLSAQAMLRCEAKLQELVAGAEVLADQSDVAFEDDPTWTWSVSTTATTYAELLQVQVTVRRQTESSLGNVSESLTRWLRDPNTFLEAAEAAEQAASSGSSQ